MAEELLRSQDRKYGTGHSADPVFFIYSGSLLMGHSIPKLRKRKV